jgi:hypothetical protein
MNKLGDKKKTRLSKVYLVWVKSPLRLPVNALQLNSFTRCRSSENLGVRATSLSDSPQPGTKLNRFVLRLAQPPNGFTRCFKLWRPRTVKVGSKCTSISQPLSRRTT